MYKSTFKLPMVVASTKALSFDDCFEWCTSRFKFHLIAVTANNLVLKLYYNRSVLYESY